MIHFQTGAGRQIAAGFACALTLFSASTTCWAGDPPEEAADSKEAAAPADAGPSPEDLGTARLHFQNGVELLQSTPPNYQDAFRQFQLASEKSGGSWKVMGNLGLCALKLERDGEALAYYGEYLKQGGDEVDPQERKEIERELLLLQGNLATLKVSSSDPAAKIRVTRQGSHAPTQLYSLQEGSAELGVRSGSLIIVAKSGDKTLEWKPVLSAGESASHVFDFDAPAEVEPAAAPAAATAGTPDVAEAASKMSPLRLAGFVTAGVGVLGLGGGAVFGIMSQGKKNSAMEGCIDDICQESAEADFNSASSMAMAANIMLIGGGVLAATGVTLIVLGGNNSAEKDPSTAHLSLTPLASPHGGGLFASGRF